MTATRSGYTWRGNHDDRTTPAKCGQQHSGSGSASRAAALRQAVAMPRFALDALAHPVVQAPLAGGPSTPALAAAVSGAGGLGFLAAGYKPLAAVRADLDELRAQLGDGVPFGVNVFAPPGHGSGVAGVAAY